MEKDKQVVWGYATEYVDLQHREKEPDRETD